MLLLPAFYLYSVCNLAVSFHYFWHNSHCHCEDLIFSKEITVKFITDRISRSHPVPIPIIGCFPPWECVLTYIDIVYLQRCHIITVLVITREKLWKNIAGTFVIQSKNPKNPCFDPLETKNISKNPFPSNGQIFNVTILKRIIPIKPIYRLC